MDCAHMNFDNTIFSFTRIMWLANPMKSLSALVADWPCRAILTEFVKTCSVTFEGHFEFYVQVLISPRRDRITASGTPVQATIRLGYTRPSPPTHRMRQLEHF